MNTRIRKGITVNGNLVENVQEFKYLGSMLSNDCNIEKEVSTRIVFSKMNPIWKYSVWRKLKLYKSYKSALYCCIVLRPD